jgi:methyl-accepting chemotaxis protein
VGKAMHQGQVFTNLEVTITGHRGGRRDVLANVFALRDAAGATIGGLCLYLDMTELKEKEQIIIDKNQAVTSAADKANELCRRLRQASESLSASIGQTSSGAGTQKDRLSGVGTAMSQMGEAVVTDDYPKEILQATLSADYRAIVAQL